MDIVKGIVFNIQRFSVHDGPGIRTTVFLKGCPLACKWCSNPESQHRFPEVAHNNVFCDKCGRCLDVCEIGAISLDDNGVKIDRRSCTNCGKCVDVCTRGALRFYGKEMTVEEVFQEIKRDELYYRNSAGGVTASGGEPLFQSDFTKELFKRCQDVGIHTTLDTCGYSKSHTLEEVLAYTDLVLFDLKLMDPVAHRKWTGRSNKQILDNLGLVAATGISLIIRMPLLPGINDRDEDISAVAEYVSRKGNFHELDLLPYHRFGESKYEMLDRPYKFAGLMPPNGKQVQAAKKIFESYGIDCKIEV